MKKRRIIALIAFMMLMSGCAQSDKSAADITVSTSNTTSSTTAVTTTTAVPTEVTTTTTTTTTTVEETTVPEETTTAETTTTVETTTTAETTTTTTVSTTIPTTTTKAPVPAVTFTATSKTVYASGYAYFRATPADNGSIICYIAPGAQVNVNSVSSDNKWYGVTYSGVKGYVLSSQTTTTKPAFTTTTANPVQQKVTIDQSKYPGLVPIDKLENYKSIRKKCTDAEFAQAYEEAAKIVMPLVGKPVKEQMEAIADEVALIFYGVEYSMEKPHYNDPYGLFILNCASCAGATRATGLCLNMLGISYEHVNENDYVHQWCRVTLPDGSHWVVDGGTTVRNINVTEGTFYVTGLCYDEDEAERTRKAIEDSAKNWGKGSDN